MKTKAEYIEDYFDELEDYKIVEIYNEYASQNSYEPIIRNDDLFWDDYNGSVSELVRRVAHGSFNYSDDWVMVDSSGDYISFDSPDDYIDHSDLAVWMCDHYHLFYSNVFDIDVIVERMEDDFKEELAFMGYDADIVDDFTDYDGDYSFEENLEEFKSYLKELEFSDEQCTDVDGEITIKPEEDSIPTTIKEGTIRIAPTAEEITITDDYIFADFAGGIKYTAEGLDKYKHDYLKACFSTAIALCSKRWQIEDILNGHLKLNGKIE